MLSTPLENIVGRDDVLFQIHLGIVDPAPHIGVRGEVEDRVGAAKDGRDRTLVEEVLPVKGDDRPGRLEEFEVARGEVVHDFNLSAFTDEAIDDVAADETRTARDDNLLPGK